MAKEPITEESEGTNVPNIEQAAVVKLDGMDWHIIEHIFVDYTGQNFGEYAKTEHDIEELRSSAIGLYDRFLSAEYVFEELSKASVILNVDVISPYEEE
jgi:hypothetical protein